MKGMIFILFAAFILSVCLPQTILAYTGPGSGLSAIGAFLALLAGIIVSIVGFLWYPIKRLLKKRASKEPDEVKYEGN
jgi:hypothetical protein